MSLVMTLTLNGINPHFFGLWGKIYIRGLMVGFPSAFIVFPYVAKFVGYIIKNGRNPFWKKPIARRILFAIIMPAFMDLIISSIATISMLGISAPFLSLVETWGKSYFNGYIIAVPTVFVISPLVFRLVDKILGIKPLKV